MKTRAKTSRPRHDAKPQPSDWALRNQPARATTFLYVVGTHAGIRAALRSGGYTQRDHDEGIALVTRACRLPAAEITDPAQDVAPREALSELGVWASNHVPRLRAAVTRVHAGLNNPFERIDFTDPAGAALSVGTLLERLREVDDTPEHRSLLATLAQRGLTSDECERLEQLVATAKAASDPRGSGASLVAGGDDSAGDARVLVHRWYEDWAITAKAMVQRRDWQVQLGVTRRRRPGE